MTQRLTSAEKIRNYTRPLLQSHGTADRLIPLSVAQVLFAQALGPKRFIVVPEARHSDDHIRFCAADREACLHMLSSTVGVSHVGRSQSQKLTTQFDGPRYVSVYE